MKVLMATDGSDDSTTAIRSAARILMLKNSEVEVLCVTPRFEPRYTGWDAGPARERYGHRVRQLSKRIVERAEGILRAEGVDATIRLDTGSPALVIVKLAAGYDVVVLGAKGKGTASTAGLGPVASRVLSHGAGSLFIGREMRSDAGIRILVATDGSDVANDALDRLGKIVDLAEAEIRILHVVESPWLHLGDEQELFGYPDPEHEAIDPEMRVEREMTIQAERLVEAARQRLSAGRPQIQVSVGVESGLPANEILSELDRGDYDLVVLGASGGEDLKHELLGSVSTKVAWNAPCSVLIVKPGEGEL